MIDSLFIIGEDKQIIIEKHWKSIVERSVLEPFFSALSESVDSNVNLSHVPVILRRMCLPFWKATITRSLQ